MLSFKALRRQIMEKLTCPSFASLTSARLSSTHFKSHMQNMASNDPIYCLRSWISSSFDRNFNKIYQFYHTTTVCVHSSRTLMNPFADNGRLNWLPGPRTKRIASRSTCWIIHSSNKTQMTGKVHAALFLHDPQNRFRAGDLRTTHTWVGTSVSAHMYEVEPALEKLVQYYNDNCTPLTATSIDFASCATHFYREYENVHPFPDGNGRTGRAWLAAMLVSKNLPPPDLSPWTRSPPRYWDLFTKSDQVFCLEHLLAILVNDE